MESIKKNLEELNRLVLQGDVMEAFEKFYHPLVVMQENEQAPTIGKQANRLREQTFFDNITAFRSAEILATAVNDNISFVIWKYDYTHTHWGVRNYTQVSVQYWHEGLIVKEQFFYGS